MTSGCMVSVRITDVHCSAEAVNHAPPGVNAVSPSVHILLNFCKDVKEAEMDHKGEAVVFLRLCGPKLLLQKISSPLFCFNCV